MKRLVLLTFLFAGIANAAGFGSRVKAGKLALASPLAKKYVSSWAPMMSASMTACRPLGFRPSDAAGAFTFVADVSLTGLVSSVEVRPGTRLSRCFADHFTNVQLPAPPAELLNGEPSLPIADELELLP
jgi:hypothetical protein